MLSGLDPHYFTELDRIVFRFHSQPSKLRPKTASGLRGTLCTPVHSPRPWPPARKSQGRCKTNSGIFGINRTRSFVHISSPTLQSRTTPLRPRLDEFENGNRPWPRQTEPNDEFSRVAIAGSPLYQSECPSMASNNDARPLARPLQPPCSQPSPPPRLSSR